MNKEERKIQSALGTVPYLLDFPGGNEVEFIFALRRYIKAPNDEGRFVAYVLGMLVGGLLVAVTQADVDHLLDLVICWRNDVPNHNDVDIEWDIIRKEINSYFKSKVK